MTNSVENSYGLSAQTISAIHAALATFPSIQSAVLYGSRAKGDYRPNSDIDLTLHVDASASEHLLFEVMGAMEELDTPYSFDISLYQHIDNDNLKDHIQRVGVEFYNAAKYQQQTQLVKQQLGTKDKGAQSEAQLEAGLVNRLVSLGYERIVIESAQALKANLKRQLEIHNYDALNGQPLSEAEFTKVLNHLDKGNVFQRAKTLRDRFQFTRDDGSSCYLQFMNTAHWCQNQYQVTHQVTQIGKYENRYDVTLLINGLPLVQIELKRRGIELKEAFNQINRYQRHSFWTDSGLFNYVQLFVISNGVNTKYYANNRKQDFKQTFYWADEQNNLITQLDAFADVFLEKCHVSKMISKYIVLHESDKILMVLRPYQYYAVEAIENQVKNGRKHGYIWHTTGSGKTLTSFKAAQILTKLPKVYKVVFVVDRADLDYQTTREFNFFSEGSVDGTDNTASLVKQMAGENKLIVTTIQKLNTAISKPRHEAAMEALRDKRVIFIFDECHRSQFGETHKNIVKFFTKAQMFGFTGTPIFVENATSNEHGKRTTKDLFGECLHKYVITNAIADENVLKFSVEYWGKLKRKDGSLIDEQVDKINKKQFFESDARIEGVVDWIIANHNRKTHNKQFSAMLCVSNKDMLIKYYETFKRKKAAGEHDLRVVTIFTYAANEEDEDANGLIGEPDFDIKTDDPKTRHTREKLESYVADYNAMYHTQHSVKDSKAFYIYYKDIAKRIKERDKESFQDKDRADILLVVNMFLTGFDAKKLNTLYVDKNLKYHGLIQAFSRTNRILGELKSQGNIVCFRNLKDNTDEAIKLFCDTNANEDILMEPYPFYVERFNHELEQVLALANTPDAVNDLKSEDAQFAFVQAFRQLLRTLNKLKPFTDFTWSDLQLDEQTFEDFKSKYLDIYDRSHDNEPGASILEEVDFELELIHRDEVNVAYILKLLGDIQASKTKSGNQADADKARQDVMSLLDKEVQLRSKRELIEKFMQEYMPQITPEQDLTEIFAGFWHKEKRQAVHALCEREQLNKDAVYRMIDDYNFTGKDPLRDQVFSALNYQPKLMERKRIYTRILKEFKDIIEAFEDHTGSIGVGEDSADYDATTLRSLAHPIGDQVIFFTDEVKTARQATELARFVIHTDQPYEQGIASLSIYPEGGELLGRGVINQAILTEYFQLTSEFQMLLTQYELDFSQPENAQQGTLFWSLSEARQGSTILEFVLNVWGYSTAVGEAIFEFLNACGGAAAGLYVLRETIREKYSTTQKGTDAEAETSIIISENIEAELAKIKRDRE
ncbi:restriction endonuclease subunit R [Methylophaga nitratireducenticrescens]|uniref:Type I restriction enzyme endonuclease subunit n=1 Tax=Methylophaga nitratireducenticrescens TaxID=754476 RepID=I1XKP8_METNJ|nr:HsdR family type I site-specific deoxyribonuclease [Methylophaga nitratireducenticrescens]AFI84967.1 restriction endonuclease subunit R [Methylophaga nitratireducenticrescens]